MFERAFAMFAPFARAGRPAGRVPTAPDKPGGADKPAGGDEIDDLKRQMEEMQKRLDQLSDKDK